MKPAISPVVVFRVPKFSWKTELSASWEALKADIAISSPSFFETIKEVQTNEIPALPFKTYFTIWKYFNRAKFRATPFGTFGAFGITSMVQNTDADPIVVKNDFRIHHFINWPQHNNLHVDVNHLIAANKIRLFSNSTFYCTSQAIRYIGVNDKAFEISEIEKQEFILSVLQQCQHPVTLYELFKALNVSAEDQNAVLELVADMVGLQLLLTEADPNIIGEDYFKRAGVGTIEEDTPYLIAEAEAISGSVNGKLFKHIPDLIDLLQRIIPSKENKSLLTFRNNFKKKFELQEVPLMVALDPETGIGYDELEQVGISDDFIGQFTSRSSVAPTPGLKSIEDQLQELITTDEAFSSRPILLDQLQYHTPASKLPLPNTFSIIGSLADDLVMLKNIGGVTANALNGRFTLASDEMLKITKDVARFEAEANEGVLFFDVAYMAEANVDNVNRRRAVYDHQLSILSYDTSAEPVTVDDIMIAVKGTEIILRSKKLNRRMVPRMASAYNYGRSDLSLFRFLCDLQHQGLQSQLAFSIQKLVPGKAAYPRVQFRNLILSLRQWQMKKAYFGDGSIDEPAVASIRNLLKEKAVSDYFIAGSADQTLCFNLHNDIDLKAFITYGIKQNEFFIEEVILPEQPAVVNEKGQPLLEQFILNLNHKERIYTEVPTVVAAESNVQQVFPPGSEWLYFEIHCHAQRADLILMHLADGIIEQYQELISKWFFIRYSQNGDHIRWRLKLKDLNHYQEIVAAVSTLLDADMNDGLIAELAIKTYKRELARYGHEQIDETETHFCNDSRFVLSLMGHQIDELQKYKLIANLVTAIKKSCFEGNEVFVKGIRRISDAFNEEHFMEPADFKKLNARYQTYLQTEAYQLDDVQHQVYIMFLNSFIDTVNQAGAGQKVQRFADLLHMHVNRMFITSQRTHEMVIYYFINKDVQRQNAMDKR